MTLLVEQSAVELTTLREVFSILLLAEQLCNLRHTGICQCILQSFGNRLVSRFLVVRQIAVFLQQGESSLVCHRRCLHRLVGSLLVIYIPLDDEVGKDRDAGVAHHAVGLVAHEVPHRELALLPIDVDECRSDVMLSLRVYECHQRMSGTIGIPQRQGGVIGKVGMMSLPV